MARQKAADVLRDREKEPGQEICEKPKGKLKQQRGEEGWLADR